MKGLLILIVISVIYSCKKDYTCSCYDGSNQANSVTKNVKAKNEHGAIEECVIEHESKFGTSNLICGIK